MDHLTKEKRSWNMSRIRSKNTNPEIAVRSLLHNLGFRFRLHRKDLPGKPDIVLSKYNVVVFVHGCFWHRHPGCKYAHTPKSRQGYWKNKFNQNIERHKKVANELEERGWQIIIIWECEIRYIEKLKKTMLQKINCPQ